MPMSRFQIKGLAELPGITKDLLTDYVGAFDDLFTVVRNGCQLTGRNNLSGVPAIDWLIISGVFCYAAVYFAVTGYNVFSELYAYKQMCADLFETDKELNEEQISQKLKEYNAILEKLSLEYHYAYEKKSKQFVLKRGRTPGKTNTVPTFDLAEKQKSGIGATLKSLMKSYIWTPSEWLAKHIIAPIWEITGLTANIYWITWFTSMVITMGIFGAFALTTAAGITGTAAVTGLSFGLVIGIPIAVGSLLLALVYGKKIISALKRYRDTGSFFEAEDYVSEAEEKAIVRQLAHEKSIQDAISDDLKQRAATGEAIKSFIKKYENAANQNPDKFSNGVDVDLSEPAEKPIAWWKKTWNSIKSGYHSTSAWMSWLLDSSKLRIAYSTLSGFVTGYAAGALVFWFLCSAVAGILILAGVGLGTTVAGSGASVIFAGLAVGLVVASTYALINYVQTSRAEARHRVVMKEHRELQPQELNKLEQELATQKAEQTQAIAALRKKVILYNAYVEKYNQENPNEPVELIDFEKLVDKFDLHSHKQKIKIPKITFPSWWTRGLDALRNAGSGFFIGRNLLLGGAVAILLTFTPISLPVVPIIIVMGVLWGLTTLIGSYIKRDNEQYRRGLANKRAGLLDEIDYTRQYNAQLNQFNAQLNPFTKDGFDSDYDSNDESEYKTSASEEATEDHETKPLVNVSGKRTMTLFGSEDDLSDEEDVESLAESYAKAGSSPGMFRAGVVPAGVVQGAKDQPAAELRK